VRIGTWNVAYGRGTRPNERRRNQMAEYDADVWILTETHDDLSPGPDYKAVHARQRADEARDVVEGSRWVSVWSRVGFLARAIPLTDPQRTVAGLIDLSPGRLLVYGTVLPWGNDRSRAGMTGELDRQAPEWSALPKQFDARCCVAGDFNVNLGGPHYYGSETNKAAVRSCLKRAGLEPVTDYDHTKEHRPEHGVIDHVAVSRQAAGDAEVVAVFGPRNNSDEPMSDHFGVVVDVNW
jgi:endonuclease/exonuclease/phosphatase family metal-dependent hydrolase